MDRGVREHSNHSISQTSNKLSESMTSLNSKQAPATSPSRQTTLTHQHSLQSNQSEINGEKKVEPTGIKFERLKNLSVSMSSKLKKKQFFIISCCLDGKLICLILSPLSDSLSTSIMFMLHSQAVGKLSTKQFT